MSKSGGLAPVGAGHEPQKNVGIGKCDAGTSKLNALPVQATCPHCSQTIGMQRCGVRLPRLKARIVDEIRSSGDVGISTAEILDSEIYRDRRSVRPATIRNHIHQINDVLIETDWRIVSDRRHWMLVRRR
jgi:hypothetical protein